MQSSSRTTLDNYEVRADLSAKESIIAVALYAAEVIRAGDEIFAHYGSDYVK